MNHRQSVNNVQKKLRSLANPEIAAHSTRFMKTGKGQYGEGDRFLGIRIPELRRLLKECNKLSIEDTLILLRSEYHEERWFALQVLQRKFQRGAASEKKTIYALYLDNTEYINGWDLVDSSAPGIVGVYLEQKNRRILYRLARSRSMWERRIAILATLHFIRRHDFDDALALAKLLLKDKEDLLHKAVGWMLREVGNRDRAAERRFLDQYYPHMPRTMLRYAIEKFPEKTRKAYLRSTK